MIFLASDHAGYALKEKIKLFLKENSIEFNDLGTHDEESTNWVYWGALAGEKVSSSPKTNKAIIICGTGIGISISANKFKGVRAALCHDIFTAEMSRKHNDSNILAMGGRVVSQEVALEIVDTWLNTNFEAGRHAERLDLLYENENKNFK